MPQNPRSAYRKLQTAVPIATLQHPTKRIPLSDAHPGPEVKHPAASSTEKSSFTTQTPFTHSNDPTVTRDVRLRRPYRFQNIQQRQTLRSEHLRNLNLKRRNLKRRGRRILLAPVDPWTTTTSTPISASISRLLFSALHPPTATSVIRRPTTLFRTTFSRPTSHRAHQLVPFATQSCTQQERRHKIQSYV